MAKPLLSIGMIVKNEIRCIEKCLQALQPLRDAIPCELVIADTGSDDGTREVAERYADILFDFTWINDFAAARNAVMDRCSGLWHFTIDADEYLDPDIDELVYFLKQPAKPGVDFASVMTRNYRTTEMKEDEYADSVALRLAQTDKVRYEGAIHEHWNMKPGQLSQVLKHTMLHHDGYAGNLGEKGLQKQKRNMELLRQELKKQPEDLRTLLQCVESSYYSPVEQIEYMRRGMAVIATAPEKYNAAMAAAFCRHSVCAALGANLPESEQWLHFTEKHFGESIFTRTDVFITAAVFYFNQKKYTQSLLYAERYLEGYTDFRTDNYDLGETTVSTLRIAMPEHYTRACQVAAKDCLELGEPERALEFLRRDDKLLGHERMANNSLSLLQDLGKLPEMLESIQSMCASLLEPILTAECEENAEQMHLRATFLILIARAFQSTDEDKCNWKIFKKVSGDLGAAARAMDETDQEQLELQLGQIKRWKEIPNEVILHAVECGAALPDNFYGKGAESLRNTAAAVGAHIQQAEDLSRWMERNNCYSSMVRFQFLYEMTAAALQVRTWEDESADRPFLELFCNIASDYLPNYYNSSLLEDREDCKALPGLHRFTLKLLAALDTADELSYVRILREALDDAPIMKHVVDYLLHSRIRGPVNPELLELAQRVKEALLRSDVDETAVKQLLQQPEYQKLLPLLGDDLTARFSVTREETI